jgi:methyltransferase
VTLGRRWNVRAAVPEEMPVATDGPYAYVRHPNYTVVGVELAALPLAFGLPKLALLATVANAALLSARIPEEEAALRRLPGWEEHFAAKKRFIPGVW